LDHSGELTQQVTHLGIRQNDTSQAVFQKARPDSDVCTVPCDLFGRDAYHLINLSIGHIE
jgi:hypothetical protein